MSRTTTRTSSGLRHHARVKGSLGFRKLERVFEDLHDAAAQCLGDVALVRSATSAGRISSRGAVRESDPQARTVSPQAVHGSSDGCRRCRARRANPASRTARRGSWPRSFLFGHLHRSSRRYRAARRRRRAPDKTPSANADGSRWRRCHLPGDLASVTACRYRAHAGKSAPVAARRWGLLPGRCVPMCQSGARPLIAARVSLTNRNRNSRSTNAMPIGACRTSVSNSHWFTGRFDTASAGRESSRARARGRRSSSRSARCPCRSRRAAPSRSGADRDTTRRIPAAGRAP